MKITLQSFKCYANKTTFEFHDGMNLLKGPSGIGKSTILDAISWVLFGHPRNVTPFKMGESRPYVGIEFDGILIQRWKKPELFQVTKPDGSILVDDLAQGWINQKYGTYNVWKASNYLSQASKNFLISLGTQERFNILYYLTFGTEKNKIVEEYHEKIDANLLELANKSEKYKNCLAELDLKLQGKNSDGKELKDCEDELLLIKKQISELEIKESKSKEILTKNSFINERIKKLTLEIPVIPEEISRERITFLEKTLSCKDNIKKKKELLSKITHEKYKSFDVSNFNCNYTEKDYIQAKKIEEDFIVFKKKCIDLSLNPECFDKDYLTFKEIVSLRDDIILVNKINQKRKQLESVKIPSASLEDVNKKIEEYSQLKRLGLQALDVISCPKCEAHLRYSSGKLIPAIENPVSKKDIDRYSGIIAELTRSASRIQEHTLLQKEISELNTQCKNPNVNFTLDQVVIAERKVSFINENRHVKSPTESSSEILKMLNLKKEYQEFEHIKHEISLLNHPIEFDDLDISTIEKEFQNLKAKQKFRDSELSRKSFLEDSIEKIKKDILPELDFQVETLNKLKQNRESLSCLIEIVKLETERNSQLKSLNETQTKIANFNEIKKIIIDVERESLQNVVTNINFELEGIYPDLFDSDIIVKLDLFKTTKTSGRINPNVHLNIIFDGIQINFTDLSGGQMEKLSFALTLAMFKVFGSGILMLDEVMNSMDQKSRDVCFSKIKSVCEDSIIVNILPDGIEGIFDQVIKLGK